MNINAYQNSYQPTLNRAYPSDPAVTDKPASATASKDNKAPREKPKENQTPGSEKPLPNATGELSEADLAQIEELAQRDREVRAHEMAHMIAGGQYVTKGASFTYQKGPDGKSYAIGGEVGIDIAEVTQDPEKTIQKMMTVRNAALAPASPSAQDRRVAAMATRKLADARLELSTDKYVAVKSQEGETEEGSQTEETNSTDQPNASSPQSVTNNTQAADGAKTNANTFQSQIAFYRKQQDAPATVPAGHFFHTAA